MFRINWYSKTEPPNKYCSSQNSGNQIKRYKRISNYSGQKSFITANLASGIIRNLFEKKIASTNYALRKGFVLITVDKPVECLAPNVS